MVRRGGNNGGPGEQEQADKQAAEMIGRMLTLASKSIFELHETVGVKQLKRVAPNVAVLLGVWGTLMAQISKEGKDQDVEVLSAFNSLAMAANRRFLINEGHDVDESMEHLKTHGHIVMSTVIGWFLESNERLAFPNGITGPALLRQASILQAIAFLVGLMEVIASKGVSDETFTDIATVVALLAERHLD